jgi:hypothetical protein
VLSQTILTGLIPTSVLVGGLRAHQKNVKKHIAVSGKQIIRGVEGVIDVEDYNQFEELVLFKVMIKE